MKPSRTVQNHFALKATLVRPLGPKGTWSRNSGWRTRRYQVCRQPTAGDLTLSSTAPRPEVRRCAAMPRSLALCDRRRLSPSAGRFHPRRDSAHRRKPQTRHLPRAATRRSRRSPTTLRPGCGGRNADARELVQQLVRVRALRAPPALRAAASSAWARRWWGMLSTAVQHADGGTARGCSPAALQTSSRPSTTSSRLRSRAGRVASRSGERVGSP